MQRSLGRYSRQGDDDSEEVDAEDDGGGGGERGRLGAERVEHGAVPGHHLFIVVTMSLVIMT